MRVAPPARGAIGAIISELDLKALSLSQAEEIKALVHRHKLVVFRDQQLSDVEYIEVAKKLGRPQIYLQANYHHPQHPEIFVSSNVKVDGKKVGVAGTGRYWHTDYQFMPEPLPMTMVYPKQWPESARETYYIDLERVYRALPAHLLDLVEGREAIHEGKLRYKIQETDIDRSLAEILAECERLAPAVRHPAVLVHPVTGAKSLYLSSGFTTGLAGLSHEQSQAALRELFDFIERPEHVHTHRWGDADLLLWDNRPLLHKASSVPPGEPSVSYRIGVYDGSPFFGARAS